jgi:hypothetical protein
MIVRDFDKHHDSKELECLSGVSYDPELHQNFNDYNARQNTNEFQGITMSIKMLMNSKEL